MGDSESYWLAFAIAGHTYESRTLDGIVGDYNRDGKLCGKPLAFSSSREPLFWTKGIPAHNGDLRGG